MGCGPGYGTQLILDRFGADYVDAIDLDSAMIARARRRLAQPGTAGVAHRSRCTPDHVRSGLEPRLRAGGLRTGGSHADGDHRSVMHRR
ncbi:class I SAM-dependent methyltransferase [Pseudonocardia alni]|uniref:class I SAM-dependent methyltransferase n=1 Tax=Pseudonocardia alni TaxID=33907 RepID=UPI00367411CA